MKKFAAALISASLLASPVMAQMGEPVDAAPAMEKEAPAAKPAKKHTAKKHHAKAHHAKKAAAPAEQPAAGGAMAPASAMKHEKMTNNHPKH